MVTQNHSYSFRNLTIIKNLISHKMKTNLIQLLTNYFWYNLKSAEQEVLKKLVDVLF